MSRILIDIDDVLYPFVDTVRAYLLSKGLPEESLGNVKTWDLHKHWDLSHVELWRRVDCGINEGIIFADGDPYPGSRAALEHLKASGHSIHLVTARKHGKGTIAQRATKAWLAKHYLPYESLTFSVDKTVVPVDYAVDDNYENYKALEATGCKVFLRDQPWNRHIDVARRIFSLDELFLKMKEYGVAVW